MISMDSSPDIIKDASDVLKPIEDRGITVMQGWYDKDLNKCHVTLWDLGETDDNFSDDDADGNGYAGDKYGYNFVAGNGHIS